MLGEMVSTLCYPGQTRPHRSRPRSARCRGTHTLQHIPRESPPCHSGCQYLPLARSVTLRRQGAHWLTRHVLESSFVLLVRSHQRRDLSRAGRTQDIHIVMHNVGESNVLSRGHSHRSHGLAIALRLQRVLILTPGVTEGSLPYSVNRCLSLDL